MHHVQNLIIRYMYKIYQQACTKEKLDKILLTHTYVYNDQLIMRA